MRGVGEGTVGVPPTSPPVTGSGEAGYSKERTTMSSGWIEGRGHEKSRVKVGLRHGGGGWD